MFKLVPGRSRDFGGTGEGEVAEMLHKQFLARIAAQDVSVKPARPATFDETVDEADVLASAGDPLDLIAYQMGCPEKTARAAVAAAQTARLTEINELHGTHHGRLFDARKAGHATRHDDALNKAANKAKHGFRKRK